MCSMYVLCFSTWYVWLLLEKKKEKKMAPRVWKYPCGECGKSVNRNHEAIQCDQCQLWVHCKCVNITSTEYQILQQDEGGWNCPTCFRAALPFASCSSIWSSGDGDCSLSLESTARAGTVGGLSVYYTNCRSLLPKMDELRCLAIDRRPDIMALVETWLDESVLPREVAISGYCLMRRDRTRHGGGVALYVHESLCCKEPVKHTSLEFISTIVGTRAGSVLLGVFYRPPSAGSSFDDLEALLTSMDVSCMSSIIMGDFNVDLLRSQESLAIDLIGVMSSVGLSQIVTEATRVTDSTSSLIDHVYVNSVALAKTVTVGSSLGTSDHSSVSLSLSIARASPSPHRRRVWLYSRVDFQALNDELLERLDDGVAGSSVETQWQGLKQNFMSIVKKHVPVRSISCRRRHPWITIPIMNMMRRRDRVYKRAKRTGSDRWWVRYHTLRNGVVKPLREARRAFLGSLSGKLKVPGDFWAAYRSMSSVSSRVPSTLTDGSSTATTTFDRASLLNDQFSSFFTRPDNLNSPCPSPEPGVPTLTAVECCGADVMSILAKLRAKTACGPDEITAVVLKKCAPAIADSLAEVFNSSLASGRLPSEWKVSNVVPIFKAGDPAVVGNYRPISLLSLVSKVLERVVHNALMEHVLEHNLVSDRQFGFQPGSSTQEAI